MNKERRSRIQEAASFLSMARHLLDDVASDEQEALDSTPDNLQGGDRAETMREAISSLETASSEIDSLENTLAEIVEGAEK